MEAEGILTALAEVAIAIAGFSGIVVVLDRSGEPWSELDRRRLSMLLQISLSCVFMSFLPVLLQLAEVPTASVWFWSSALWLVYIFLALSYRLRQMPSASAIAEDPSVRVVMALMFITVAISAVAQIANVAWLRAPWPHVFAIILGLLMSSIYFVRLFRRVVGPVA